MHRRLLSLITLLLILSALPVAASQFIDKPFDDVARESALIVRGTIAQTWSAWDDGTMGDLRRRWRDETPRTVRDGRLRE